MSETLGMLIGYVAGFAAGVVMAIAFIRLLAPLLPVPPHSHEEPGE